MAYSFSQFAWVVVPSVFAGTLQGITGFGFGMLIMLFLPVVFPMQQATTISQCLSLTLSLSMFLQYRKEANGKRILLPLLSYFPVFFIGLNLAAGIDSSFLKPMLGLFLIFMAAYMILFSGKITIREGLKSAIICGGITALGDAFFAIGGPPIVIYFLSTIKDRKEYLGTMQAFIVVNSLYGLSVRFMKGYITAAILPLLLGGIAAQLAGLFLGSKIGDRIDSSLMKKLVYGLIGVAGAITFITNL